MRVARSRTVAEAAVAQSARTASRHHGVPSTIHACFAWEARIARVVRPKPREAEEKAR